MTHQTDARRLPSAVFCLEQIKEQLKGKRAVVFLDYDGTLTPIVSRPQDALLSHEMRNVLRRLAALCTVAVISGRDRADVAQLVGLHEIIYAGSHGFDISGPDDLRMEYKEGEGCLPDLDQAERELVDRLAGIPGAQVERKRFAIAVHYRNAEERDVSFIMEATDEVSRNHSNLKKGPGKKVIELKPAIDWDKGRAVLWLLDNLGLARTDILPFYLGDDLTDEDAFRALSDRGIAILVGEHGEKTYAGLRLNGVQEVQQLLEKLTELLQQPRGGTG